jgi:hypothetical protein
MVVRRLYSGNVIINDYVVPAVKCRDISMVTIHLTPTNQLAIELQHISKKYPILSVFYRYQKRFKYHILALNIPQNKHIQFNLVYIKHIQFNLFQNKHMSKKFILKDVKQD